MNRYIQLLLMTVCLFDPNLLFAEGTNTSDLTEHKIVNTTISGESVLILNAVFDDYLKSHQYDKSGLGKSEDIYTDLHYYVFTIHDGDDFMTIEIGFNQSRLRKERNLLVLGGTAKYYWNKKLNKIEKKMFFK